MSRTRMLGPWQLLAGDKTIDVGTHGSWEDQGLPKDDPGPYTYQTRIDRVDVAAGERLLLRFGAVSYAATILVDDIQVGEHVGLWDSFDVDVTAEVGDGNPHIVTIIAEKPASLTCGPDSDSVLGRFPTRQVLAGFLPYVWGHIHGGIWQPVELIVVSGTRITDLVILGDPDGLVEVAVTTSQPAVAVIKVFTAAGILAVSESLDTAQTDTVKLRLPQARAWSPSDPYLYTASVTLTGTTDPPLRRQFGLRQVAVGAGSGLAHLITLNSEPLYLRMVLSWGWYPDRLSPDPGPERVRADLRTFKQLGFNGVKLCLWFPPGYYFDIADELGMLLWVELPMWLPTPSDTFAEQLSAETDALVRQARRHPSVIIYTLGCELGAAIGTDLLGPLYAQVKDQASDALVCDNSGSGEAYGGADETFTDFYDHHLYTELEYLQETFEHFAPAWRTPLPWLFGEFCDYDTYRDLERLASDAPNPWWLSSEPSINPQGARWQFDAPFLAERLTSAGWYHRGAELERISNHGAQLHRKVTTEYVRSRTDTSGYVITGERDTPISTSGLLDDHGVVKVDQREFAEFTADSVLLLAPERRRRWVAGGDRVAPLDQWSHPCGTTMRTRLLIAHHGRGTPDPTATWTLIDAGSKETIESGRLQVPDTAHGVHQIGVLKIRLPNRVGSVTLSVKASVSGRAVSNEWTFWVQPENPWAAVPAFGLFDPADRFPELTTWAKGQRLADPFEAKDDQAILATRWTSTLDQWVRNGGRALVILDRHNEAPFAVVARPFWRESVKVIELHPWWANFPHDGVVDLQFLGCATDAAMDTSALVGAKPLLRRVDTRTGITHDYATSTGWGQGQILFSSLRFEGGRGSQPVGLDNNTGASALLATWFGALLGKGDATSA